MKRLAIAAVVTGLLTTASFAADMAVKARPVPVPVFSWTGCYIGINAGYSRADVRSAGTYNAIYDAGSAGAAPTQAAQSIAKITPDSITIGAGAGCNYQAGMFVVGAEGDLNYTDLGAQQIRGPFAFPPLVPYIWEERFRSDWYATARARAGVVVAERGLLYVTGGAAFAHFSWYKALDQPPVVNARYQAGASDTKVGWVVGVGGEYAFDNNWSAKLEYLHMDFGSSSAITPTPLIFAPGAAWTYKNHFREDVVRVGINYRLGLGGAAVVAKY